MKRIAYVAFCIFACLAQAHAETMLTSFYNPPRADIAAHKSLPFGTVLKLTNPHNGRNVIVKIHDRGPFIGHRQLDISRQKAEQLGFIRAGVITLSVEVLYRPR